MTTDTDTMDTATEPRAEIPPSLLTDIAQLDLEASPPAAALPGQPGAPLPPPDDYDYEGDARDVVDFAAMSFSELYPSIEKVWDDARRKRLAVAAGRVMKKHKWTADMIMFGWGPEIMLAGCIIASVPATYRAVKADMATQDAAAIVERNVNPPKTGEPDTPPSPKFKPI
jgi:hypothetical protein